MATCVACHESLTFYVELDEEEEDEDEDETMEGSGSYVDDDVLLPCGCHFHWQCFLDSLVMSECPSCGSNLITTTISGEQQLLCNLRNEGGLQEGVDMLPIITEESYFKAYPEERRCRAFLEFCGEGDVKAIVDTLNDGEDGEENEISGLGAGLSIDILRYQDQIGSMDSGLHAAVQNERVEVAWLLLLLASTLEIEQFPAAVLQAAQHLGIQREDQNGKVDIRSLKDSYGMTAEQRANLIGESWTEWLQSGRLKPPAS